AARPALEFVAGPRTGPAVSPVLPALLVAGLVGLRWRGPGRQGLPLPGLALLGTRAAPAGHGRSGGAAASRRGLRQMARGTLRVPRAGETTAREAYLVRQRPAAKVGDRGQGARVAEWRPLRGRAG